MALKVVQINLHHSSGAANALMRLWDSYPFDVALIQEPWVAHKAPRGLGRIGTVISPAGVESPRTCILVRRGIVLTPLPWLTGSDLTVASWEYQEPDGRVGRIILAAAYLPGDLGRSPPGGHVERLVDWCGSEGNDIVIGMDANAHHTIWGSSDINPRGEALWEYIISNALTVANRGDSPTFEIANRREVLDLTLVSMEAAGAIRNWRVGTQLSLSDHKYILFDVQTTGEYVSSPLTRNIRKTDWTVYAESVKNRMVDFPRKYGTRGEINHAARFISAVINECIADNCPPRGENRAAKLHWWNKEIHQKWKLVQRQYARARKSSRISRSTQEWESYKKLKAELRRTMNRAKIESWRSYCQSIERIPEAARLNRMLESNPQERLGALRKGDGSFTTSDREALQLLMEEHFPGFKTMGMDNDDGGSRPSGNFGLGKYWDIASRVVTVNAVEWAVGSFSPYKSAGADGIQPIMLQRCLPYIKIPMTKLMRACIATGVVPEEWTHTKVVFIPKPAKEDYTSVKSFRPISLTSFMLKTLEKLVDRYLKDTSLKVRPLHLRQHAFRAGHSAEVALHELTGILECSLRNKRFVSAIFMDIEGAFNQTPIETILRGMSAFHIEEPIIRWIVEMLSMRSLRVSRGSFTVEGTVARGCPQGGILSPLLWCFAVDGLIETLSKSNTTVIAYADDVTVVAEGCTVDVVYETLKRALFSVEEWCETSGLRVNPTKTELIHFRGRRRKVPQGEPLILFGTVLEPKTRAKYLGVHFESNLSWRRHVIMKAKNAKRNLAVLCRVTGKTWGLTPKIVRWIYEAIIIPRVTFGALIWWQAANLVTVKTTLRQVQGGALRRITGTMGSTPTAGLEMLLNQRPLQLRIKELALRTAYRIKCWGLFRETNYGHSSIIREFPELDDLFHMPSDLTVVNTRLSRKYKVSIPSRVDWSNGRTPLPKSAWVWYTDGSLCEGMAGAAWTDLTGKNDHSINLGRYCSVYQAELLAIEECARCLIDASVKNRCICICSDSQAALLTLLKCRLTSKIATQCMDTLNALAGHNRVQLFWVPGHRGILGNERADELARLGTRKNSMFPEPAVGVGVARLKLLLRQECRRLHELEWSHTADCRQAKVLLGMNVDNNRSKSLMSLNKRELTDVAGVLTGHGALNYNLFQMRVVNSSSCDYCGDSEQTSEHILGRCPRFTESRYHHFGDYFLPVERISTLGIKVVLAFLASTEVLKRVND